MECAHIPWPSNEEFLRGLSRRAAAERVPLSGSLALTHRCNLRCVHCYLSGAPAPRAELTADQWRHVLDEVAEAGCLTLLVTGGEPLLRSDFGEIYRHARSNGLLVTVFTNGTLVSDEVIDLFAEYAPRAVELTLYGATAGTYERITGVPGSYDRCRAGMERLLRAGINVRAKTVLMTLNAHEFSDIEQLALDWGVRFRFDAAIFPRLNGDRAPLALALLVWASRLACRAPASIAATERPRSSRAGRGHVQVVRNDRRGVAPEVLFGGRVFADPAPCREVGW